MTVLHHVISALVPSPSPSPSGQTAVPGIKLDVTGVGQKPSQSITVILLLTVLSVAPALLIMCTSFTKIVVVLSMTRNALGLQNIPPNQVLAGMALFLSLFVMSPTLEKANHDGLQPYLHGTKTQAQAWHDGSAPVHDWMLKQTRQEQLALMTSLSKEPKPATPDKTPFTTLIPAFVLSELRAAFIIGFVIFIPFLVIDLVVSSSLMSLGMMMVPPVLVSLPFKILLFVMVDGWGLIAKALVTSYR